MEQIRRKILLVDDHAGIVLGVKSYLEKYITEISITYFTDGMTAINQIQEQKFDVYIIDIELQDIGGMELIKMIKTTDVNAKIIIYTQHQGVWDIINFQLAGVNGIVIKGPDLQPLKEAIIAVINGDNYICNQFRYISTPNNDLNPDSHLLDDNLNLKKTELEIIQLLAKGLNFKEIAKKTHYSEKSISKIKDRIFKKLSVNSVPELITKTFTNGFPVNQEIKKRKGY